TADGGCRVKLTRRRATEAGLPIMRAHITLLTARHQTIAADRRRSGRVSGKGKGVNEGRGVGDVEKFSPRFFGIPVHVERNEEHPKLRALVTRGDLGPLAVAAVGKGRRQTPVLTFYALAAETGAKDKGRARHHPQRTGVRPSRVNGLRLGIGEGAGAGVAMRVRGGDNSAPFATFLIVGPAHGVTFHADWYGVFLAEPGADVPDGSAVG